MNTSEDPSRSAAASAVLDAGEIARVAGLAPACVEVVDAIDSTNRELMARPGDGIRSPATVLVAERQLAGRGRQGRSFVSDPLDSLTFSVAIERQRAPGAPPPVGLPLALGIAVARVASGYAGGIGLKWPNDLQRDGRKCSGMLVESRITQERERVVIGLGINLRMPQALAAQIDQPATGLFDASAQVPPRSRLAGEFAQALIAAAHAFFARGLGDTILHWAEFDVLAGREVNIIERGQVILSGAADGLDPTGALRVRTASGVQSVAAGDVSVRPRPAGSDACGA